MIYFIFIAASETACKGRPAGNFFRKDRKTDGRGFTFFCLFSILFPADRPFGPFWKRRAPHDNERRGQVKTMSQSYGIILTGGSGTRLWPRSREDLPKQFLALCGPGTLLQDTLRRMLNVVPIDRMRAVTGAQWEALVAHQAREVVPLTPDFIVQEPMARGTAPAVLLGIEALREAGAGDEDVVIVAPSDHIVQEPAAFSRALELAVQAAREGFMATLGVVPSHPETGFGYIRKGAAHGAWFEAEAFVEKPDLPTAETYVKSGDYLWNSGVFAFALGTLAHEMGRTAPDLAAQAGRGTAFLREAFPHLPSISFDCAVMERAGRVAVTPLDAGWSDVGSWDALHDVLERDDQDNAVVGDVTLRGARNCLVDSRSRLTVLNGVEDLVVVDSPDALFVTRRGASQEVRAVVKELKGRGRREVSQISESSRPWGSYRVLHEDERHRVKRSVVMPGRSVPLQTHRHSTERWIVLCGTARATLDGTESFLCEGMELFIPRNVPHGLENCGCIDLELIVVQDGEYLGPDDA